MKTILESDAYKALEKRIASFAWRTVMMMFAGILDMIVQDISIFNMPNNYTIIVGLVLGEISKQIANHYRKLGLNN